MMALNIATYIHFITCNYSILLASRAFDKSHRVHPTGAIAEPARSEQPAPSPAEPAGELNWGAGVIWIFSCW